MDYTNRDGLKILLNGERAAIGGYLPQYDEFAIGVYEAMAGGDLEEIRVADMAENVGKLDDIVYVTSSEVKAYQVKWSTVGDTMSYLDFKDLIAGIVEGWRNLKRLYPEKRVLVTLLTNKQLTIGDRSLKTLAGKDCGGFSAFERDVIRLLNAGKVVEERWAKSVDDIKHASTLTPQEWESFWSSFTFHHEYHQELIEVASASEDQRVRDIIDINRRIQELVARPGIENPISSRDFISLLGWTNRFKTIFDHNLSVPEESYVPNARGMALLDNCLKGKTKGYIFLKGSPGSGKSTLLTQWTRGLMNPSVRFYAFDFLNPSSQRNNNSCRGSELTFLNDIVMQIHKVGIDKQKTLPPVKEKTALKEKFYGQLEAISENYNTTKVPFVIVVDGLDHITREYKSCLNTLMDVLPSPSDLPEGVILVLGSQRFDQIGLNRSVEKEASKIENNVEMPPLSKTEAAVLCRKLLSPDIFSEKVFEKCWSKSQGHPLYLRYLLNQIMIDGVAIAETMDGTPEGVDDYYSRIIDPLLERVALKEALGLISRIAGIIKLDDIRVLCQEDVLYDIKKVMWHLFRYDKAGQELTFFHNSFKQYLLNKTAEDVLTNEYDGKKVKFYYRQLANHFKDSWNRGYYLFHAEEYDLFVNEITPESLYEQAKNYRPLWSLRRDMEKGVEIGRLRKDPYLLVRYLLLENQLSQMGNHDYSVFSLLEDFIKTGRGPLAKAIIREGRYLYCSQSYAMNLSITFLLHGDHEEANLLFDLSYPDFLSRSPEEHHNRFDDLREKKVVLTNWVKTAAYFVAWPEIEKRIALFVSYLQSFAIHDEVQFDADECKKTFVNAFLSSLIEQDRWPEFDEATDGPFAEEKYRGVVFKAYDEAIVHLNKTGKHNGLIKTYFCKAEKVCDKLNVGDAYNLRMSYLAVKSRQSNEKIAEYLDKVSWVGLGSFYQNDFRQDFNSLSRFIFYVKTRAKLGAGDKITELVPEDKKCEDNDLMVNYARRLFTIAQMSGGAKYGVVDTSFLAQVKFSIRSFDMMQNPIPYNKFAYTLSQQRGDFYEFVVESAASFGKEMIGYVAQEFEKYFSEGSCQADADSQRTTFISLYRVGYDKEWCKRQLCRLNQTMMNWQDVDGRELESLKQGRAWLELGCNDKAEDNFRQMIEESFGVGYRKDYQPSLFAEWIGEAIKNDTTHTNEYVHWLTSRLKHIETIAESSTRLRAAERLLDETLSYNLRSGVKLAVWLLNKEYDYFQSVSSSLIIELLKASGTEEEYCAVFRYFTLIHLYVDDNDSFDLNTGLLKIIIKEGKRVLGGNVRDYYPILKSRIETECPENIADGLLRTLEDQAKRDQDSAEQPRRESDKLLTEAVNLLKEGRKGEAWQKTMAAIGVSSPSGWARNYDGGTRLNACKVLLQIDEERGREFAIDLFARDIPKGWSYGTIQYLDEIMPLLAEKVEPNRLFEEEFAYMNRIIREDNCCEEDKPEINPDESPVCVIVRDWLLYLANMPVVCVKERAIMLLALLLNETGIELTEKNCSERILLEVGCYLVELHSGRLAGFKDIAQKAALSENYQFRVYAVKILEELDVEVPKAPFRELAATYKMFFPETTDRPLTWLPREKYIVDVNWRDASSIMSVASHWGGYLAHCTGIDRRTLDYRAVQLMRQYGDITACNASEDRSISYHYDKINLRYPSKKAHVQAALDGMLAVAAELKDGGAVKGCFIDSIFVPRDFGNINVEARNKPDFIQRLAESEAWSVDKNWLDGSHLSQKLNEELSLYNGAVVIGEYCHIKKMCDNLPLEEYQVKLSFDSTKAETPPATSIFGESPFMGETTNYLNMGGDDPELILFRGSYYTDFSNKSRWIAINPALAFSLGLKPCKEGYFAWQNDSGEKVVESVFWQSGNINGSSRGRYEASEGWMVVAKPEVVDAIREYGNLYVHKMVLRRFSDNLLDTSHKAYVVKILN